MPDDEPNAAQNEGFGFADEIPPAAGTNPPDTRPKSRIADFGTLDANPIEVTGDDPADPSDEPAQLPRRVKPKVRDFAAGDEESGPEVRVDEVWSRGQEWGSTLSVLGAIALATLLFVYFAFAAENFGLGFFLFCAGGIAFILMSYPIVITLERPVRMTPEQAIRDYYAALSHHRPHFRRMWLLLSTTARSSPKFGSFEGFVQCWRAWLQEMHGTEASPWTPLHFEIDGVKAEKSTGKNVVRISYVVRIFVRGRRDEAPLATIPRRQWTVRGPDGMWYLDDGTPPVTQSKTSDESSRIDT